MLGEVSIDGSYGEGGGQIVRASLSLAVLTGRPVEVRDIRAARPRPGLARQHLTSVLSAAALCDAEVEGARPGSRLLRFVPRGRPEARPYRFEVGTAGSTGLVLQTVLAPLAFAGVTARVCVSGGTHVPFAPPAEYLERVYARALGRAGLAVGFGYREAGFYPRGGGEAWGEALEPSKPEPFFLAERGRLKELATFVVTAGLPERVGERGAAAAGRRLRDFGRVFRLERREAGGPGPGAAVVIAAACEGGFGGFTALGAPGKPMETVAHEAVDRFRTWWRSGAACDEHLADQLALPAALAAGESRWSAPRVSSHVRTVLWVLGQFLPVETRLEERGDGTALVTLRSEGIPG